MEARSAGGGGRRRRHARLLIRHALHGRIVDLLHQQRGRRAGGDDEVAQVSVRDESYFLPLCVVHALRVVPDILDIHGRRSAPQPLGGMGHGGGARGVWQGWCGAGWDGPLLGLATHE